MPLDIIKIPTWDSVISLTYPSVSRSQQTPRSQHSGSSAHARGRGRGARRRTAGIHCRHAPRRRGRGGGSWLDALQERGSGQCADGVTIRPNLGSLSFWQLVRSRTTSRSLPCIQQMVCLDQPDALSSRRRHASELAAPLCSFVSRPGDQHLHICDTTSGVVLPISLVRVRSYYPVARWATGNLLGLLECR